MLSRGTCAVLASNYPQHNALLCKHMGNNTMRGDRCCVVQKQGWDLHLRLPIYTDKRAADGCAGLRGQLPGHDGNQQ